MRQPWPISIYSLRIDLERLRKVTWNLSNDIR